jgi:CubicO group peptidase (beta-lactamase class C family)
LSKNISGYIKPGFEAALKQYQNQYDSNNILNGQVCAYVGDECVIDLCGDASKGATPDSLFLIMSSSKVVASILMGIMVSKGHLNLEEKVSTYWPEFAQKGKENIKVEDIMRHEGGMHKLDT